MRFLVHTPGSAPTEEGAGTMHLEGAGDNIGSKHPEGARKNDDSILDSLSPHALRRRLAHGFGRVREVLQGARGRRES
jgi:hypothetical protein